MTEPKLVGRRWTRAEEKQLQDMLDAGMTAAEVATKLGRTRQAELFQERGCFFLGVSA